jgi:tRNA-2-methylthio-N6-dimethylallyladenosine synthase
MRTTIKSLKAKETMRPETFYIRTFGCQMNEHDSDRMAQQLSSAGMRPAEEAGQADLIVINSCSVRAKPEHKAISEAGRYKKARQDRGTRIIIAGCVARQEGKRLLEQADYLDGVLGPDAISRLVEIVDTIGSGRGPVLAIEDHDVENPLFVPLGLNDGQARISGRVTIMKGCNNFCAYCVVPYLRGREVSKAREDILEEVAELSKRGAKEVTLLGQNVNSYLDQKGTDFPKLLKNLDELGAVERIRFTSSHPKDLTGNLIQSMSDLKSVVEHLHLALQSGSSKILKKMRRGYTRESYYELAQKLRQNVSGISLTTDLIVGFPGETEADFEQTLDLVEKIAFDGAFSFKYSPRPGTLAARWEDDVPEKIKQDRLKRLHTLLGALENTSLNKLVGKNLEVLVEGDSLRDKRAFCGRSPCNRVINFESKETLLPGDRVNVNIIEARGHTLWGQHQAERLEDPWIDVENR